MVVKHNTRLKIRVRLLTRCGLLILFVAAACVLFGSSSEQQDYSSSSSVTAKTVATRRSLHTHNITNSTIDKDEAFFGDFKALGFGMSVETIEGGGFVLQILVALYMFIALAIVCDEYFVPCLEVMADTWNVSDEIAGATLMAAGGSAPELFTSFIGTFTGSSVGFGTIVGSAVFNVLFVIGMCALASIGPLALTWWPLFRDSLYYIFSLVILAIFFGVVTPDRIDIWEAALLLVLYCGYIVVMYFNEKLHAFFSPSLKKRLSVVAPSFHTGKTVSHTQFDAHTVEDNVTINTPFMFRAGIMQYMVGQSKKDLSGIYAVTKIKGTLKQTFDTIDGWGDSNGKISMKEFGTLFKKICKNDVDKDEVKTVFEELDTDKSGDIDLQEFKVWYKGSANVIKTQIQAHFQDVDCTSSGFLKKRDVVKMLRRLKVENIVETVQQVCKETELEKKNKISRESFMDWFLQSEHCAKMMKLNQEKISDEGHHEDDDHEPLQIRWPEKWHERIMFLITFPLVITLWASVLDVRDARYKKFFVLSFILSIIWIGVYSYIMVGCITLCGNAVGIPVEVMGLTFLAAGTSVPDLLSSVIVARKGLGDMAVSSSIGSNIFDILIGLPLPWLSYGIYRSIQEGEYYVDVVADTLFVSVLVLVAMVIVVVLCIHLNHWKMTKRLGVMMFVLYLIFLAQDLARAL